MSDTTLIAVACVLCVGATLAMLIRWLAKSNHPALIALIEGFISQESTLDSMRPERVAARRRVLPPPCITVTSSHH